MWWNLPSFVSKREVRRMLGVGKIAECIQCLFLDREGTKEQNREVVSVLLLSDSDKESKSIANFLLNMNRSNK